MNFKKSKTLKLIDLFSGIGGFSLAAKRSGAIKTVLFCEKELYCQKVLKKNFPGVLIIEDIKGVKNNGEFGAIDIISGGFPCQPFSIAGRMRGTSDNRDLWPEMFRVIKEFKPTWVIGENVAQFVNMAFTRTKIDLESEGYEVQPLVIPACAVGAYHQRNRVWIIAHSSSGKNRRLQHRRISTDIGASSENVANTEKIYVERRSQTKKQSKSWGSCGWAPEPRLDRMAHGIPYRVDRLKCLGNAIVPQVAAQIFFYILELEKNFKLRV